VRAAEALRDPGAPLLCQLGRLQELGAAGPVAVVDPGDFADRESVGRSLHDLDGVPRAHVALRHDAEIGAGPAGGREPDGEVRVLHARTDLPARRARLRDLEESRADRPALADDGGRHVQALHGEVLAEGSRLERTVELARPPVVVLTRVGVGGLVRPAVEAPVGLVVAGQVDARDGDAALDRRLPDRGRVPLAEPLDLTRETDVDGDEARCHGDVNVIRPLPDGVARSYDPEG
jgi:hypothetical protein